MKIVTGIITAACFIIATTTHGADLACTNNSNPNLIGCPEALMKWVSLTLKYSGTTGGGFIITGTLKNDANDGSTQLVNCSNGSTPRLWFTPLGAAGFSVTKCEY